MNRTLKEAWWLINDYVSLLDPQVYAKKIAECNKVLDKLEKAMKAMKEKEES